MRVMKHRVLLLMLAGVLCLGLAGCKGEESEKVSVQSVSMLMGSETGRINRYGGLVVSQNETEIQRDDTKTIEELLVSVGDAVSEGQVLFTYDKENLSLTIQKAELEVEQAKNQISAYGDQIEELEKERSKAASADKLSYTIQIQSLELDRREAEYNLKVKETELENMKHTLESNEVKSPVSGRVKSLNENGGMDQYGNALPFMTIVESGSFRIKGTINENNRMDLMEGMPVIIRSRTDLSQCWNGVVEMINWEAPESGNSDGYFYGVADEMATSSKYPFYITLDSSEGLILGQHVYIEPDYGQGENTGVWLDDGYLVNEGGQTFVWAASSSSVLEKRAVTVGEHDDAQGKTEITEGLAVTDYVAWPDSGLKEGMGLVYYDEDSFEQATENMDEFVPDDMDGDFFGGDDGEGMNGSDDIDADFFGGEDGFDGEGAEIIIPDGEGAEIIVPDDTEG